jgi:hypothetical protein
MIQSPLGSFGLFVGAALGTVGLLLLFTGIADDRQPVLPVPQAGSTPLRLNQLLPRAINVPNSEQVSSSFCIQGVRFEDGKPTSGDEEVEQAAVVALESALTRVAQSPEWGSYMTRQVGNDVRKSRDLRYSITFGCRSLPPPHRFTPPPFGFYALHEVPAASDPYLFLFILSPQDLAGFLGDPAVRKIPHESACLSGRSCGAVSWGLYLTPAELQDVDFVADVLLQGVGLIDLREVGAR